MSTKKPIRVRIAPSPTGYFHIGTARTALFNWLFVKKEAGAFILRIEDTDKERSKIEFEQDILENLKWLGLTWDEFYRQSERTEIYEKYLRQLLKEGYAYYCFCTEEELEQQRQASMVQGLSTKYSGRCRNLTSDDTKQRHDQGQRSVIRLIIPEGKVVFNDLIRGKISSDPSLGGDIVIAKSLTEPLYNVAVVIDDFEMKISHVIRGEDHISNTPKQILLQKVLGFSHPTYAHLPLILDPDRSKMSKRHSATSIREYREQGYLPEALVNFLALLGWHPAAESINSASFNSHSDPAVAGEESQAKLREGSLKEQEIFNQEELIQRFDISRVQKSGAIFNQKKLDWLNAQYIKKIPLDRLTELVQAKNKKVVELFRDRLERLIDFKNIEESINEISNYDVALLAWKDTPMTKIKENLEQAAVIINNAPEDQFTKEKLSTIFLELGNKLGRGELLWPLRVALSGKKESPSPFELLEVLGKEESLKRIQEAIQKLDK